MFNVNIKDLFNRTNKDQKPLSASQEALRNADASLIVAPEQQPGPIGRFMIRQAGGYDPKYYTSGEAKEASLLVGLKFASVSLATYSVMKMIEPGFQTSTITTIPEIGNIDPRIILVSGATVLAWWGISKLDTAVMHNIRARRVEEDVKLNIPSLQIPKQKIGFPDYVARLGVSLGSLVISLPALLVTTSQESIDQYIKSELLEKNRPVLEEYETSLENIQARIQDYKDKRTKIEESITVLGEKSTDPVYTSDQSNRLTTLRKEIEGLEAERKQYLEEKQEEQRKKNDAEVRIIQETEGIRGSIPGCEPGRSPLCQEAIADRDDAARQIALIDSLIAAVNTQIININTEVKNIDDAAVKAREQLNSADDTRRAGLNAEIISLNELISKDETDLKAVLNPQELAQKDVRYIHFNPDMTARGRVFVEQVLKEANPLELLAMAGLTLMIASAELGVFFSARSRPANMGEKRAYLAELVKTRTANEIYDQAVERIKLISEGSVDEDIVQLRQRVRVLEQNEDLFKESMEQMKNDPEFREKILKEVLKDAERYRYKSEETKMSDMSDSTVVKDDIGENTEPSDPKEEKPEPKPQMI